MFNFHRIVGITGSLAAGMVILASIGCGQKGPLTLPKEPAAQGRATLPQVLNPAAPTAGPATAPTTGPATPPASAPAPSSPASSPQR